MSLTSIANQLTPGKPIEVTFAADLGLPSDNQEILLIGHKHATSGTATVYEVETISNVADPDAATTEANAKFGAGSEMAKMVIAAVKANSSIGSSTMPAIKCVPLASGDVGFGASDEALTAAKSVKAEFVVSPYDGDDSGLRTKLKDACATMSGAQRVHNNQFGTIGVIANFDIADPANLPVPDTQYLAAMWLRDSGTPDYSIGEFAAACAARMASNVAPFNPLDNSTIGSLDAPALLSDYISVGAGLESETALAHGWTPLKVKANGEVAFVRTITTRLTTDQSGISGTHVGSYYDVQDFQVLYYWRKTLYNRFNQPDLTNVKASADTAKLLLSEVIRLATSFEDNNMFQAVKQLAKSFVVQRSSTDRHRFDVKTPVNVIPGLHVIATNIQATTEFDELVL